MSAPRIRRVTSDSLAGRKLAARSTRIVEGPGPTAEQRAWNDRVDAERQAKGKAAVPGSALAQARQAAHAAFDPKWQRGRMTRSQAYMWLAVRLGISKTECHILNFDIAKCERVIEICGGQPPSERILDLFDSL